jgi:tetratricopeptide (TPR) repeat protein
MPEDPRVEQLLEELLDSDSTPEDVCRTCPELLPEVRAGWQRLRALQAEVGALFPQSPIPETATPPSLPTTDLPRIPGYEVQEVLGYGGMGVVYKAWHRRLQRPVAVKMLLAGGYAQPRELERFLREAETVARLDHANVVQVHEAGDVDGRPYFTMEFVEGGSLAQKLAGTPQPARQAAALVARVAEAVHAAHQRGIVHRDLKPGNILLTGEGTPKLTDFGLARRLEGAAGLTQTGAPVGTPSYMAPEQAEGKSRDVGPTADIYALGAVFYELLTGRPPFRADTAVETFRQVVSQEPAPPSRLNAAVPRDAETICLKCLEKEPQRRYASALALAEDLHRFLDGEPVLARPVGVAERTWKWARRRPALATLLAAVLVLLGGAVVAGIVFQRQESQRRAERARLALEQAERAGRARQAIETAVKNAYQSGRAQEWRDGERILADATNYVTDAEDEDLARRLEQAKADLRFARELDEVHQKFVAINLEPFFVVVTSYKTWDELYGKSFQNAGFDIDGDAAGTAARIRAEPLAKQTLAAIEEWALAAFLTQKEPLQLQLLGIAKLAQPGPEWWDHVRDPALWQDKAALLALAQEARKMAKPPATHQLVIMGALLRNLGEAGEETRLLSEAVRLRPEDQRLNWELADALTRAGNHAESAKYRRVINALNPRHAYVLNGLAAALSLAGDFEQAIPLFYQASELQPKAGLLRHNLVQALIRAGRSREAQAMCRRAIAEHPDDSFTYHGLGLLLWNDGRFDEAIVMFRKALSLKPDDVGAHGNLGQTLLSARRWQEAAAIFRETIQLRPSQADSHHGLADALSELGRHEEAIAEYQWVIRNLDPSKKGTDAEQQYLHARLGLIKGLVCLGRFREAENAARPSREGSSFTIPQRKELERQLEICRLLGPLTTQIPAILSGGEAPADLAVHRALAEWCYQYRRLTAASARLFGVLFARQPALADDLAAQHRYHGACAAAWAGCGLGDDASTLDDKEKTRLANQALHWLAADCAAWEQHYKTGELSERRKAAEALHAWEENTDLDCVRTESALAPLPEHDRQSWQQFWARVKTVAVHAPLVALERAHRHAERKQWAEAARVYAELAQEPPSLDDYGWFEYAAVQLLSGNVSGYHKTCQHMLGAASQDKLRRYLATRACTLATHSAADNKLAWQVGLPELQVNSSEFWSLTEQAALKFRAQQYKDTVALCEQSLQAESEPGRAVLNWLWLALAHQQLGDPIRARDWLVKATAWLDTLGNQMPADASAFGLNLHNWLEAHVLRREAESLPKPPNFKEGELPKPFHQGSGSPRWK